MLKIEAISYSIEGRPLFSEATATIPDGHKVGIVGRNGTGKTTLFRLIRGEIELEGGRISISSGARIGGVAQEVPSSETSLLDTVLAADTERLALLNEAETAEDPQRIGEIYTRLADIDAYSAEGRASSILKGLGFSYDEQLMPCSAFSGGWRMRVALAAVLFSAPDILLLDEPTNYLDLEGAVWLENYLSKYPHSILIISHDRGLLNRAVNAILHLESQSLTLYNTPFDGFLRTRNEKRAVQSAMAKKQEAQKAHMQKFVDRFRAKASKAKQAQARLKMIERMDPIAAPEEAETQKFSFPEPEKLSPPIVNIDQATVGYDDKVVLKDLNLRIDQDDRIALLGKNGEGKSTLSKLISGRLAPMSGSISSARKLRIGYFAQHQVDELDVNATAIQHLTPLFPNESPSRLRARLAGFGLHADTVETKVAKLSGGQKARLSLLLATLDAPHLLILDEPTNHLDIESRAGLVEALTVYSGAVVLVSHDMHLVGMVADRLWLVSNNKVSVYTEDLETYRRSLLSSSSEGKASLKKVKDKGKAHAKETPSVTQDINALQRMVRECEKRLIDLENLGKKIEGILADAKLYEPQRIDDLLKWQKKQAQYLDGLKQAEMQWEKAVEALSIAESEKH